jgi:hypothetical protein
MTKNKDFEDTHAIHFTKFAPLTFITETIITALACQHCVCHNLLA